MGDRKLVGVLLDADCEAVEDWAFANCVSLREIWLPVTISHVSEKAFLNCEALERIGLYDPAASDVSASPGCANPVLLALALKCFPRETDALIAAAKDETAFLQFLDLRLEAFLAEDDTLGFVPFLAGGEEDYATEEAAAAFRLRRQFLKTALIYERLPAEDRCAISSNVKNTCLEWLHAHNPAAAFGILLRDTGRRDLYLDLYFTLELNRDINIDALTALAEDQPELKAKVLRKHLEASPSENCIFSGLRI